MFTGIVTGVGTVRAVAREGDSLRISLECPYSDLEEGESVAVNGTCLTAVECGSGWFSVDAVVTTRGRTTMAALEVGNRVNLERALRPGDRMGGHLVQGHVDGVGEVRAATRSEDALMIDVRVPDEVAEVCVPHGSIALDGVSLTISEIPEPGLIRVALIPYTVGHTTLGERSPGDRVNVEADMIGKLVRRLLEPYRESP